MQGVYPQADGSVLVDGADAPHDLNRTMDWNPAGGEATTIAGLLIHGVATIPEPGQIFVFHGFRFAVIGKTRSRITNVKVTPAS